MVVAEQKAFGEGDFGTALKDGFLATDRCLILSPDFKNDMSGCTATTAIIANNTIYVANAGDSRTVLGVKGTAKPLSFDHKPQNEGERARIVAAGGFVDCDRVNGNLALSRAIGDFDFKKSVNRPPEEQIVTAYPDIMVHDISADDEFLVLACDGIWDCMTSQNVVEFVRRGIAEKQELSYICENIMEHCLAPASDVTGLGCDNMTILIVGILNGKTKEEWYDSIAERVSKGDGPVAPLTSAERVSNEEHASSNAVSHSGAATDEGEGYDDLFRRTAGAGITLQQLLGNDASFTTTPDGSILIKSSSSILSAIQRYRNDEDEDDEDEESETSSANGSKRIVEVEDAEMKEAPKGETAEDKKETAAEPKASS